MKRIFLSFIAIFFSLGIFVPTIKANEISESIAISHTVQKIDDETLELTISLKNNSEKVIEKASVYYVITPAPHSFVPTTINNVDYKWSLSSDDSKKHYLAVKNIQPGDEETVRKYISLINYSESEIKINYSLSSNLYSEETEDFSVFDTLFNEKTEEEYYNTGEINNLEPLLINISEIKNIQEEVSTEEENKPINNKETDETSKSEEKKSFLVNIFEKIKKGEANKLLLISSIVFILLGLIIIVYKIINK